MPGAVIGVARVVRGLIRAWTPGLESAATPEPDWAGWRRAGWLAVVAGADGVRRAEVREGGE
jgi:hypothetical protein